jgi:hypothetical protein
MSCLGCSSSVTAAVYVVIHSEVFQMLEEMIKQDALNAINYIDLWIQKQISDADFNKLNQLKTKAMNTAIMKSNSSSLPNSPRFVDESVPIQQ